MFIVVIDINYPYQQPKLNYSEHATMIVQTWNI